jgi:hypothetical protein
MKWYILSYLCATLLFWAAFNDVLAAQTPEVDDDIAAAMDNDFLQCAPVNVPPRAIANPLRLDRAHDDMAGGRAALRTPCLQQSVASLTDPLYQFMSLQR